MTTASAPVLSSITLPVPKVWRERRTYRGGALTMANGAVVHDLVDTEVRRTWFVRWEYVDDEELEDIADAYETIKNTQGSLITVLGDDLYGVRRPEGGEMQVEFTTKAGGELAYHVEFEMIEGDD